MMFFRKLLVISFALFALSSCASNPHQTDAIATVSSNTFDNGFFYAIHAKQESSDKIELRLMINSGSLSETDEQSGYAHLLEHMAFNGTKNFPKLKIFELFEKSGLTLGHDINAYTSFNETVYTLSIPKSNPQLLADTLLYLRDILIDIKLEQSELDKEKGIVENEYHLSTQQEKSYDYALFDDYIKDSEYENRLPIGTIDSIKNSTVASVNAFYKDWYRPNNARLLITGDVDSESTTQLITALFATIDKSKNNQKQPVLTPPALNTETQAYSSKVINFSQTDLFFEVPEFKITNSLDLSQAFKLDMLSMLFNYRLNAANDQREEPFRYVGIFHNSLLGDKAVENIAVSHQKNESQQAVKFIAQELARIQQYGFSQAEFYLQLAQIKSAQAQLNNSYINQDAMQLAEGTMAAWSTGNIEFTLDIEQQAYQLLLSTVSLEELNQLANELINSPRKMTFATPYQADKPDLFAADKIFANTINQPIDNIVINIETLTLPIVKNSAGASQISSERYDAEQQLTQWQLSNGVSVVLQPDHSIKNSIHIKFTAPGGTNAFTKQQRAASYLLINSYLNSGLEGLSAQTIQQRFNQERIDIMPIIDANSHGFNMYSINEPESLELLFSMLYSSMTNATVNDHQFSLEKKSTIEYQQNSLALPEAETWIKTGEILFPHNPQQEQISVQELAAVQQTDIEALYQTLFNNANDYKLTIVGDFDTAQLKPIILQYVATLPKGEKNTFDHPAQSLIAKPADLDETTNPQNNGQVLFYTVTNTPNQSIKAVYQAELMQAMISQTLTKIVREQLSLTYSPSVRVRDQAAGLAFTEVMIELITKVEDIETTQQVVDDIIDDLLTNGITQAQLDENKKIIAQDLAYSLNESPSKQWLLHRDHLFNYALGSTENAPAIFNSISVADMNQFIRVYLDPSKTLRLTNRPQQ
ncbi:Protease precursor [Moritella sp. JT01]|uniref:M16 family metallopeptidase n=1 Tax=Moritella sp. JT01 TaxID=756698 RepID=UPI000791ED4F|nr:M16 family metallopeptidase [Moritella sp. JT01]KXO09285.1 Protease precursor [Moritella sp. JT01]